MGQELIKRGSRRFPWLPLMLVVLYLGLLAALVLPPGVPVLERLRWLVSGLCAQVPSHSFSPGGQRLPLDARCTGIYLGFIVTLITLYVGGRGRAQRFPPWPIIGVLVAGVIAMAIDGFNSLFLDIGMPHLYQPQNLLRLATGLATGLAMACLFLPFINHLFWREPNQQRSIPSWKALVLFLPGLLLSFLAVASQNGLVLYPVAFLSTAGIVMLLSSVNLIVVVAVNRRDQALERYRELLPFFSLALLLALSEMLALAQLKFLLLQAIGV